jgi:hypothetical protein
MVHGSLLQDVGSLVPLPDPANCFLTLESDTKYSDGGITLPIMDCQRLIVNHQIVLDRRGTLVDVNLEHYCNLTGFNITSNCDQTK